MHSKETEKITIVLMVLMVFATLAGLWVVKDVWQRTNPAPQDMVAAVFQSELSGLSFTYPAKWQVNEEGNVITLESLPQGDAPLAHYPYMQIVVCPEDVQCSEALSYVEGRVEQSETLIAGALASVMVGEDTPNFFHAAVDKGGQTYHFTTFANEENPREPDPQMANVLSSITWVPLLQNTERGYLVNEDSVAIGEFSSYTDDSVSLTLTSRAEFCEAFIDGVATPELYTKELYLQKEGCTLHVQKDMTGWRVIEQDCEGYRTNECSFAGFYETFNAELAEEAERAFVGYSRD